jgi:hypothetical protein
LGAIVSPNQKTLTEWVNKCQWDKKADDIISLSAVNKISLEGALTSEKIVLE